MIRRTALIPGSVFRRRSLLVNGFSLLLVGGAAYKIGQSQAQQIQQYIGRPPEDLSTEELEIAINALNIVPQELNDHDKAAIEAEAISTSSSAPKAPSMLDNLPPQDYKTVIQNLASLRDLDIITEEEFEAKKKQLLEI